MMRWWQSRDNTMLSSRGACHSEDEVTLILCRHLTMMHLPVDDNISTYNAICRIHENEKTKILVIFQQKNKSSRTQHNVQIICWHLLWLCLLVWSKLCHQCSWIRISTIIKSQPVMMVTFPVKQVWIMLRIWWKLWSSEVQYHTMLLQNKTIFYIEYFNPNEFCFWIRNVKQYFSINILSIFMTKRVSVILFILKAFNKKCNSNPNWIKLAKVLKL